MLDTIQNGWRVTAFWQVIIFISPVAFILAAFGVLRAAIRDGVLDQSFITQRSVLGGWLFFCLDAPTPRQKGQNVAYTMEKN